jgi:tetratricopeptide (TPR) repeat protein
VTSAGVADILGKLLDVIQANMHETASAVDLSIRSLRLTALAFCICLVVWAAAPLAASAQSSPNDKALAESLFDRGLELMRLGKDEEACQALERSQGVEPGVGTMLYLAECYEKLGRTASAWAMYREAASLAQEQGQTERAKKGATRAEFLQSSLSKLTLVVPADAAVPGLLITRNGNVVPSAALGSPVPVDPGEQKLTAAAPGYAAWSTTVDLPPNGARLVVDVPKLQALPPSETPQPPLPLAQSGPTEPAAAATPPPSAAEREPRTTYHKPLAYALGGVGIVALGVGSYFGVRAISENNKADEACPALNCGTAQGREHNDAAHSAATAANILVAGGAALLAAGIVVFLVRPREDEVNVALTTGPGSAQLQLQGTF